MTDINSDIILTRKEVAQFLKVSERTVQELSYAKKIPHFKVGRTPLYSRPELLKWLDRERRVPGTPPSRSESDQGGEEDESQK